MASTITTPTKPPASALGFFERYLSLWVALCMIAGILLGRGLPTYTSELRGLEFVKGSQINMPIAVLIWLMITPMMMKVDFSSVKNVGRRPAGLLVTLFVNWVIKPFSMALLAWLFFRFFFCGVHQACRCGSIYSGLHYPGSGTLHGYGVCLESSYEWRCGLHPGPSVGE